MNIFKNICKTCLNCKQQSELVHVYPESHLPLVAIAWVFPCSACVSASRVLVSGGICLPIFLEELPYS